MKRWILCALLCGCNQHIGGSSQPQVNSLQLTLRSPTPDQLGEPTKPVQLMQVTYDVQALDENGNPYTGDLTADVFISFGGVKTGADAQCGADVVDPLETITLTGGQITNHTTMLPLAFGATTLWLDEPVSHATGASPTIYFRDPYVDEVQKPADPTAADATFCSPYNNRFLNFSAPRPGGQLVVSSVFADAFSVVDTGGNAIGYNYIYVYSFGKPPGYIVPGAIMQTFSGNYSKFVGFTELNFPLFVAAKDDDGNFLPPDPSLLPPPIQLAFGDLANQPKLISSSAGVVEYKGTICDPAPPNPTNDPNIQKTDDSWNKYNQFVVDNDGTCDSFTNFAIELPAKTLGNFDPTKSIGSTLDVIGMLQNHSGQNAYTDAAGNEISCSNTVPCAKGTCIQGTCYKGAYNFWTILPRTAADIVSVTPAM